MKEKETLKEEERAMLEELQKNYLTPPSLTSEDEEYQRTWQEYLLVMHS